MTWGGEFKAAVEHAGGRDEDAIDYIDVASVTKLAGVTVRVRPPETPDKPRVIVIT